MDFDPNRYAQGLIRMNAAEEEAVSRRLDAAFNEAARIARLIKENDPEVRRVILFGSVARRNPSRLDFDIDLALDGGDTYKAMDITEASSFEVDIVDLRLLAERIHKGILEHGIVL